MSIQAIRGFKDILPAETPAWQHVETMARGILDRFGYEEIRIPIVERTELFARGIGEDTDIVEKEMYTFPDRKDKLMTLRPEATAGVIRSVIEHSQASGAQPLKVFVIGPMFRYERPQKGRQRQFHQLDVEAVGDDSAHMDAEIIVLLDHFLKSLDLDNVMMNVNSLGCPECRPAYKETLISFLEKNREEFCPDCKRRMDNNPLRVLDCKNPQCIELSTGAPMIGDMLCDTCRGHFDQVQNDLTAGGVKYVLNPKLVRGLDYYSRTTFEALTGDLGAQNAVAGGGRYDGLAKIIGGPQIPATGWALGLERLVMLLTDKQKFEAARPDLFVAALDDVAVNQSFGLIQALRKTGVRVAVDYSGGSLKSRMKRADKSGAAHALILGPDEISKGEAILRNMKTKDQSPVPLSEAAESLASRLLKGE